MAEKRKNKLVHIVEKMAKNELEIVKNSILYRNDTRGIVDIECEYDTHGRVDK